MKKTQTSTKKREGKTKKDKIPSCKNYSTCERPEKEQGRCNSRCCRAYKEQKS